MTKRLDVVEMVRPWSPWWEEQSGWQEKIESFERPVFKQIVHGLETLEQIISITGPRRVGKSTLQRQLVRHLINGGVLPEQIAYYSFDDPTLYRASMSGGEMFELLMGHMHKISQQHGVAYLLLDEVQTLERWEQYLKKYYDLQYPFKFVVSGSASSPIFKKSRESLLGRIKDFHMLPFSFREYAMYRAFVDGNNGILEQIQKHKEQGDDLKGMNSRSPDHIDLDSFKISKMSDELWAFCEPVFNEYLIQGGFPEVWKMQSQDQKIDYLFDNQVKKVIMEDLVLAVELRKPELLKRFYISLLEQPGREVNKSKLSQELGIGVSQINKYLPLLEMTDLVRHVDKFRASSGKVRTGSQKFYPIDMALRNAVLRLSDQEILEDSSTLGLYAEAFVFNALKQWDGVLAIDFFRDGQQAEVDFVVHTGPSSYMPIEVKYADLWRPSDLKGTEKFLSKRACHTPIIVTKKRSDYGKLPRIRQGVSESMEHAFCLPLIQFLLMI